MRTFYLYLILVIFSNIVYGSERTYWANLGDKTNSKNIRNMVNLIENWGVGDCAYLINEVNINFEDRRLMNYYVETCLFNREGNYVSAIEDLIEMYENGIISYRTVIRGINRIIDFENLGYSNLLNRNVIRFFRNSFEENLDTLNKEDREYVLNVIGGSNLNNYFYEIYINNKTVSSVLEERYKEWLTMFNNLSSQGKEVRLAGLIRLELYEEIIRNMELGAYSISVLEERDFFGLINKFYKSEHFYKLAEEYNMYIRYYDMAIIALISENFENLKHILNEIIIVERRIDVLWDELDFENKNLMRWHVQKLINNIYNETSAEILEYSFIVGFIKQVIKDGLNTNTESILKKFGMNWNQVSSLLYNPKVYWLLEQIESNIGILYSEVILNDETIDMYIYDNVIRTLMRNGKFDVVDKIAGKLKEGDTLYEYEWGIYLSALASEGRGSIDDALMKIDNIMVGDGPYEYDAIDYMVLKSRLENRRNNFEEVLNNTLTLWFINPYLVDSNWLHEVANKTGNRLIGEYIRTFERIK